MKLEVSGKPSGGREALPYVGAGFIPALSLNTTRLYAGGSFQGILHLGFRRGEGAGRRLSPKVNSIAPAPPMVSIMEEPSRRHLKQLPA